MAIKDSIHGIHSTQEELDLPSRFPLCRISRPRQLMREKDRKKRPIHARTKIFKNCITTIQPKNQEFSILLVLKPSSQIHHTEKGLTAPTYIRPYALPPDSPGTLVSGLGCCPKFNVKRSKLTGFRDKNIPALSIAR